MYVNGETYQNSAISYIPCQLLNEGDTSSKISEPAQKQQNITEGGKNKNVLINNIYGCEENK